MQSKFFAQKKRLMDKISRLHVEPVVLDIQE